MAQYHGRPMTRQPFAGAHSARTGSVYAGASGFGLASLEMSGRVAAVTGVGHAGLVRGV